ncbi:MAG: threonylcarbamoyl-AMP synthase [Candidatus Micrarchaeota archaeon]|nr:threonylcarbamoyl-AMP synthase [Candidatus Micrarchaeota archaeon]MDE1834666.1 threonylcarbamoyl-AMP synthase [Candidatus Micrarchaeota archaeon]MDE1858953.1 threonylcarbamoyl-AMP synthase [Candidatus Micrarchaeota archaeon]
MTLVLKLNPSNPDKKKIGIAANAIKDGMVVVFPTETVYGIGANALDRHAVEKIFKIKGRPSDNPLIVHVSSVKMAESIADIDPKYMEAIKRIWPGPLTIIAKAKKSIPKNVTGGLDTVAIRMPDNKIALSLIKSSGLPIAAPSANISKKPSSTKADHARGYFNGKVDIIIDGGRTKFGIESTVIDLYRKEILRPGAFTQEELKKSFHADFKEKKGVKDGIRSPGMKYTHYSPSTKLLLFTGNASELPKIASGYTFTFIGSKESSRFMKGVSANTIILGSRKDLNEIASNLFEALIKLDSMHSKFAIIEGFPEHGMGFAIMNRLRKAARGNSFKTKTEFDKLVK